MVQLSVVSDDRRERTRAQAAPRFLDAAGRIIDRDGLDGVTMQAVADELDCAVGTIYTYFPSKAALLAALQQRGGRHAAGLATAPPATSGTPTSRPRRSTTTWSTSCSCVAFGAFFIAASVVFADEFHLQRLLLTEPVTADEPDETRQALPVLQRLFEEPRSPWWAAVEAGVLEPGDAHRAGRCGGWPRSTACCSSTTSAPSTATCSGPRTWPAPSPPTCSSGWGASRPDVEVAASHVERLAALGPAGPAPGA